MKTVFIIKRSNNIGCVTKYDDYNLNLNLIQVLYSWNTKLQKMLASLKVIKNVKYIKMAQLFFFCTPKPK